MKLYTKVLLDDILVFTRDILNKSDPLASCIFDLQQSWVANHPLFFNSLMPHNVGSNDMIWEVYAIETLSETEIGIYFWCAWTYESFDECPEEDRLKMNTDLFIRIIQKWQEEESLFRQDPESYKQAIERGEKVFEIEEWL